MLTIPLYRRRRTGVLLGVLLVLVALLLLVSGQTLATKIWGAALLAGGAILVTIRHYLEIDTGTRRLSRRFDLIHGFRRVTVSFADVQSIVLAEELRRVRTKRGSRTRTVYLLRVNSVEGVALCELQDMWLARLIAERVCRAMSVDMQNRLMGGSSTRTAAELDLPLAERWRLASQHKEAPVAPADSRVEIVHENAFSQFSVPVEPLARWAVAAGMIAILAGLYALARYSDAPVAFVAAFFAAVIVFMGVALIAQHTGHNRVRFTADTVEFHRGAIVRQRIPLASIEELLSSDEALVLMSDVAYLLLDRPSDAREAALQLQFVEHQIAQRQLDAIKPR